MLLQPYLRGPSAAVSSADRLSTGRRAGTRRHLHRNRRVLTACSRPKPACTGWCIPRSTSGAAARLVRVVVCLARHRTSISGEDKDFASIRFAERRRRTACQRHRLRRASHLPTGIVVSCQNERSRHRNRDSAMRVLKARFRLKSRRTREAPADQRAKKEIAFGSQIPSRVHLSARERSPHKEQVGDVSRGSTATSTCSSELSDEAPADARPVAPTTTLTESLCKTAGREA